MNKRITLPFVALALVDCTSLDGCTADISAMAEQPAQVVNQLMQDELKRPYVAQEGGRYFIVITETPEPTPTLETVVIAYGAATPYPPTCMKQRDGAWRRNYTGEPCVGWWPSNAYAAIPTPQIAMNMGPHESRVYVEWPGCHYGADGVSREADGGGICPWTSSGYSMDDPRYQQQVGP